MRVLLFALVVLGGVTATIANNKGHQFGKWFVIGFVLGPIGLFWAGVTPPTVEWEANRRHLIDQEVRRIEAAKPAKPSP